MSFVASTVGTIPIAGFNWYLVFLEGPFGDEIRKQIDEHFITLGREVGPNALVVRGYDPTAFRKSVMEASAFYDSEWYKWAKFPALLVTDKSPAMALSNAVALNKAKVILFPLEEIYRKESNITGFLAKLLEALQCSDAVKALDSLEPTALQKGWGWLSRYVGMKPGIFGFHVDVNNVFSDLLARLSHAR